MQLTVSKDILLLALSRANGIVAKRSTMPILSNILLETEASDRFTVTATDLDIFSKGEYEGHVGTAGRVCLNAKDLLEIARNLPPGNVDLESDGDAAVRVRSGKIDYRIRTSSVEDYPAMPSFGDVKYFKLPSKSLGELIEHTLFSVANDDPRIFLNGVNLERQGDKVLRLVSTDGHRLSRIDREMDVELPLEHAVIIPRKGLVELRKVLEEGGEEIEIAFAGSNGFFRREGLFLVMRLIEGEFPDYNMVIPKATEKVVTLGRGAFQDALRRMSILSAERSHGVRLKLAPGELVIESSDPEKGEAKEVLDVEYDGSELQAGFNARFFMDVLNIIKTDEVVLELSDELSPCVVRKAGDEEYLCVIMPIRIS